MKSKLKLVLRPVIFGLVVIVMLSMLNTLFNPVWTDYNNYFTIGGFYKEPKNTVETVFLGASVPSSYVSSTEMYKEYGLCAYSLANPEQPVIASYYLLEDAYNRHEKTLKNVFFDVSELRDEGRDQVFHKALDYMPLSILKIRAVYDYCDGDFSKMFNFIYPFSEFHNRWPELVKKDFEYFGKDPVNGTRGYTFFLDAYRYKVSSLDDIAVRYSIIYEDAKPIELVEDSLAYFDRIVKFCEEKGLNLVLTKFPTNNWNSKFHNAIAEVAEEYGLEFIDFNFEPYMSEIGYNHAFDNRDGGHGNYFGATKISSWLGKYLVDECGAKDVRNDKRYAYMEKQADRYDKMYYREFELYQSGDITEYITTAMKDNNSILLTVKEDAASALTDEQREFFRSVGLEKLAIIETGDAYIGAVENGKVLWEQFLSRPESEEDAQKDNFLSHFIRLKDGARITLVSGFRDGEYVSSCTINGKERSQNKKGMNIVVYSNEYEEFIADMNFNTSSTATRKYYDADFYKLFDDEKAIKENSDNKHFMQALIYSEMFKAKNSGVSAEKIDADNDVFSYLDKYLADKNNVIILAVKDDASKQLTDADREMFKKYGLQKLSGIKGRDSYVAIIDGGEITFEEIQNNKTPLVYKEGKFEVTSAGFTAGSLASIKINGKEYAKNVRGLNVVIYNKKYNQVFDSYFFELYAKPIKTSAK